MKQITLLLLLMTYMSVPHNDVSNVAQTYVNNDLGYSIEIYNDMQVDDSLKGIVTTIKNNDITLNIYYDDFTGTYNNYKTYVGYSNNFLNDTRNHTLLEEQNIEIDGKPAHFLAYTRGKLAYIANDKNYYCSAEIKVTDKKVYTVIAKTNKSNLTELKAIINSFKVIGMPQNATIPDKFFKKKALSTHTKTQELYKTYFSDNAGLTWGIFEPDAPYDFNALDNIESITNYDFKFLVRYQGLSRGLPQEELKNAENKNKYVELTLQTMNTNAGEIDIYEILNGRYEEYFSKYARDIKSLNTPVLFRLNNEMNGDWCGYSSYFYCKDPELYVETWKYIYNIFRRNNVTNVLWVWNPNHKDFPGFKFNHALMYYPGDEYVDIVGLTAYNTGNYFKDEYWTSFDELYADYYSEYARIFEKPLMITEFGSSTFGGDKVEWVKDMFDSIKNYPRIKVAIWWSGTDRDEEGNPGRIYRIDTPIEVLSVFRDNLAN
ncbi:MAG: endoglucanase [Clostridia bacterium]|nr:endoglucanase [Clostridia bacterium]